MHYKIGKNRNVSESWNVTLEVTERHMPSVVIGAFVSIVFVVWSLVTFNGFFIIQNVSKTTVYSSFVEAPLMLILILASILIGKLTYHITDDIALKGKTTRYDFENVPESIVNLLDNMSCGKLTSTGIILNEPQKADDFDKAAIKLLAMWELEGDSQNVRDKTNKLLHLSNSRIGIEAELDALKHEKDMRKLLKS